MLHLSLVCFVILFSLDVDWGEGSWSVKNIVIPNP